MTPGDFFPLLSIPVWLFTIYIAKRGAAHEAHMNWVRWLDGHSGMTCGAALQFLASKAAKPEDFHP